MSDTSTYKTELQNILSTIVFDSSTLGAKNIIRTNLTSDATKPYTEIDIFGGIINSKYIESRMNTRTREIVIRIHCKFVAREAQAQADMEYLQEEILTKLEASFSNSIWGNGHLDNGDIFFTAIRPLGNFFISECKIPLRKYVMTS